MNLSILSRFIFLFSTVLMRPGIRAQPADTSVLISPATYINLVAGTRTGFIFDVRTKEEFDKTHIQQAVLAETTLPDSALQLAAQNNAIVLLYSIANGRSVQLAKKLRKEGYVHIYALDGGIASWISGGYPFYSQSKQSSASLFRQKLATDSIVVVDVASAYCPPCVKVARIIDSFSRHHPEFKIVKLDMDADARLIAELQLVQALPAVVLYKAGKEIWRNRRNENWAALPERFLDLANNNEDHKIR